MTSEEKIERQKNIKRRKKRGGQAGLCLFQQTHSQQG